MTDVAIPVMLIAGFVEESYCYHWENVSLGVFIFALKSVVVAGGGGGVQKVLSLSF
jgi:hypothetical protein